MGRIITIDDYAADGGAVKTFQGHIDFFNARHKVMMDASDVYNGEFSEKGLKSFRKDCVDNYVVITPKSIYETDGLFADIVHHYGSKVVSPRKNRVEVPVLQRECIKDVVSVPTGLKYQQAYWGTRDGAKRLVKRVNDISGLTADKIFCLTPNKIDRKNYPERASGLYCSSGEFHVNGSIDGSGRSRGVRIGAEGAELEKSPKERMIDLIKFSVADESVRRRIYRLLREL